MKFDEPQRRAFIRKLLRWGRQNRRNFPWREETDPFRILVAEVLLQRSRGGTVAKVYAELFARWPDEHRLAEALVEEIEEVIRPLGLTRRAVSLKRMAGEIVDRGGVPRSVTEMIKLSGVGRYAASTARAAAFGHREGSVDGTSARVYRRYFGIAAARDAHVDEELWGVVAETTPHCSAKEFNWAVLDLAAMTCLPKVPRCPECPLKDNCITGRARIRDLVTAAN